ncbi:FAD binding domain-containing protein [Jiella marina]|uniref:FAD binding domain-containing protein n=1 Tax=Jiella sp. LLJ827 TaxID=2917712 RepID=UPI0021015751|nr:xanthine dehydrogenase family protein subunit M [Jiella sp. LLJ827]MCQ0988675.1 xanthine dehydrogenase family protein subunit M [Jiella sp. LLJ827]
MTLAFHRPSSIADAAKLLAGAEDGKFLAGGMTLLPTMRQRLADPSDLVDLSSLPGLAMIERTGDGLVIGALTRHADVAGSEVVKAAVPALAALAGRIGDPQVRYRGTIGGSIANNDPAADYPAALLALDATVVTDRREIAADDFFLGTFETALETDEIVTAVRFPIPLAASYEKLRSPASRYALVGVFVARFADGVRVAVTGAGPCVFRSADIEEALASAFEPSALDRISIDASELNSDLHADADYRAHMIMVLTKRAVAAAIAGH